MDAPNRYAAGHQDGMTPDACVQILNLFKALNQSVDRQLGTDRCIKWRACQDPNGVDTCNTGPESGGTMHAPRTDFRYNQSG